MGKYLQFLIQRNIWHEYGYDRLVKSILDARHVVQETHVIPFTTDFQETVRFTPDYVFGSTRFINICRGKFFPTFKSFDPTEFYYPKELWVNGEGKLIKLGDIKHEDLEYPVFMKPVTEKFFTGKLIEKKEDLDKIQLTTSFIPDENEELIWISSPKNIGVEYRFFIINNEIATASSYKSGMWAKQNSQVYQDHPAWHFVKDLLKQYGSPDKAFCLDVGYVNNNDWKIIELNNFNSSGIYACNTDNIVRYLTLMSE